MRQGWEYKKLGDVASYINGFAFKPEQWKEEGTPIIRIQNLNNPDAPYNYYDGDIPEQMSYGAFMTIICSDVNPYLFGYFKTPAFREYLVRGKTTTVNQITVKMLNDIMLPLPPLPLQQTFASRIEKIEHQKAEVQKAITELETLLASRMQYWFE